MSIWELLLKKPIANLLFFLYQASGQNLGFAILLITLIIGLAMIPLMLPSLKSAQKMQKLKPELDKLNQKHKGDKQALALAQMELYKKNNINPASGFLPMIVRLLVVIALYQVLNLVVKGAGSVQEINNLLYSFIKLPENTLLNTKFLYLDILKPDTLNLPLSINLLSLKISSLPGILLIGSALAQYFSIAVTRPAKDKTKTKPTPKDQASSQPEMAETMQKQMALIGPMMTLLIGYKLPSGLVLSWLVFSLVSLFQQFYLKKQQTLSPEVQKLKSSRNKESKFL